MVKESSFQLMGGSVTAPEGFRAAGVFCDIKRLGTGKGSNRGRKPDLVLIVSDALATVVGTFIINRICAAPVKLCLERMARGTARAIVANSGNANACTGRRGLHDAQAMARAVAAACRGAGISPRDVLVASTGRIGVPLPMTQVKQGILDAARLLAGGPEALQPAERMLVMSDSDTMSWLHRQVWLRPSETLAPWWQTGIREYAR